MISSARFLLRLFNELGLESNVTVENDEYRLELLDSETETTIGVIKAKTMEDAVENLMLKCVAQVKDSKVPTSFKLSEL